MPSSPETPCFWEMWGDDLAQKSDLTIEDLASHLYDSLREKIMTLPDDTIVYPAMVQVLHAARTCKDGGSVGDQKANNYALGADMTREEFIKEVTDGLAPPPAYFPMNVAMNKEGYDSIDDILTRGTGLDF